MTTLPRLRLVIANKNYSSWSMRPWVLLTELGVAFEEVRVQFGAPTWASEMRTLSPSGLVPVLWIDDEPVWDTLAIVETAAELWPEKGVWPREARARQVARSMCAEMHAGFRALRSAMPMNIRGFHPGKGMNPDVRRDIDRIVTLWTQCRERFGAQGPLLFGTFSAADAYFAPVVSRFATYDVALPPIAKAYCDAVQALASVRAWSAAGRAETEVVAEDEPYGPSAPR